MISAASLNNALRDFFADMLPPRVDLAPLTELPSDCTPEKKKELVIELPPVVVLSLAERIDALVAVMSATGVQEHRMPKNWTTCALYDMQGDDRYLGVAYINTDTGQEFMVERDGKEYWL